MVRMNKANLLRMGVPIHPFIQQTVLFSAYPPNTSTSPPGLLANTVHFLESVQKSPNEMQILW